MTQSDDSQIRRNRRQLIKNMTFVGGAAATIQSLPSNWEEPLVKSAVLPAHAENSFPFTCTIDFSNTATAMQSGDTLPGTYNGDQAEAGPFFGCDTGIGFDPEELVLTVELLSGNNYRFTYSLPNATPPFSFQFDSAVTESITGDTTSVCTTSHLFTRNFLFFDQYDAEERTQYSLRFSKGLQASGEDEDLITRVDVTIEGTLFVNKS